MGNRTVLNQQCTEGSTMIEEKLQGIHPPQVQCNKCHNILFCKVCLSWRIFSVIQKHWARTKNIYTQSLRKNVNWRKLSTVKTHFGWEFWSSIFSLVTSAIKIKYTRVHGQTNKKNKFEGGPSLPDNKGFYQWFCCLLWRSPCIFCSVHKLNFYTGAWFANTKSWWCLK